MSIEILQFPKAATKEQLIDLLAEIGYVQDENLFFPRRIYKIAVNITNTGTTEWSSEHLHGKAAGKFEISKEWSGEWKLQPGETTQVYYKITAPGTSGKYRLKVSIINDGKKVASRTRKINVVSLNSPGNR